jgi:hypothetical protein
MSLRAVTVLSCVTMFTSFTSLAGCKGGKPTASPSGGGGGGAVTGPVLLVGLGEHMMPMGCWDAAARKVVGEDGCLASAKVGDPIVVLSPPGSGTIDVTAKEAHTYCTIEGEDPMSMMSLTVASGVDVAFWPSGQKLAITLLDTAEDQSRTITDEEQAALEAALAGSTGDTTVKLANVEISVLGSWDVDGDGKADTLFHVHGEKPGEVDMPTEVSGIFAAFGDAGGGGKPVSLRSDTGTPSGNVSLTAVTDLGADGRHELLVYVTWGGGSSTELLAVDTSRTAVVVSSFGCDH